jgi:hypothetical protein
LCLPPVFCCVCRFKKYLSNLSYLIDQEGDREELEFEWSSPMSGRPGRFFRIAGFRKEHALVSSRFLGYVLLTTGLSLTCNLPCTVSLYGMAKACKSYGDE